MSENIFFSTNSIECKWSMSFYNMQMHTPHISQIAPCSVAFQQKRTKKKSKTYFAYSSQRKRKYKEPISFAREERSLRLCTVFFSLFVHFSILLQHHEIHRFFIDVHEREEKNLYSSESVLTSIFNFINLSTGLWRTAHTWQRLTTIRDEMKVGTSHTRKLWD